jgi:hypothetical protein
MKYNTQTDWAAVENLISDWRAQACSNQDLHARAAKHYRKMHYWLGIPVVVISSAVGSVAFASLHEQGNDRIRLAAGIISMVAAILASLQTFLGFGERAEKHRAVGIGYERVRQEIEEIQGLPVHLRGNVKERLDVLREKMDALADDSPEVPRALSDKTERHA